MRVDVSPRQLTFVPGSPQPITVSIANTETVIAGFTVRVLGADPGWVEMDSDEIALFPDESREISIEAHDCRVMLDGERGQVRIHGQIPRGTCGQKQSAEHLRMPLARMDDLCVRVDKPVLDHPQRILHRQRFGEYPASGAQPQEGE